VEEILCNTYLQKKLIRRDVRLGDELFVFFQILRHDGLRQGDALSLLLFNFALEYAIRKVGTSSLGLSLIELYMFGTYANVIVEMGDVEETTAETLKF
jgi:hypothetical protein